MTISFYLDQSSGYSSNFEEKLKFIAEITSTLTSKNIHHTTLPPRCKSGSSNLISTELASLRAWKSNSVLVTNLKPNGPCANDTPLVFSTHLLDSNPSISDMFDLLNQSLPGNIFNPREIKYFQSITDIPSSPNRLVDVIQLNPALFPVHGVSANGFWGQELGTQLSKRGWGYHSGHYGRFLLPNIVARSSLRRKIRSVVVERHQTFMNDYDSSYWKRIVFLHSFGVAIYFNALLEGEIRNYPDVCIVAGGIVGPDHPAWQLMIENNVKIYVEQCGKDYFSRYAKWLPFLKARGSRMVGFHGYPNAPTITPGSQTIEQYEEILLRHINEPIINLYYPEGGHSYSVRPEHFENRIMPLISIWHSV